MSLASRLAPALLLLLASAAPVPAEVTAEQAAALQDRLRAWIADLVGDVGDRAIQVAPAGARIRITLPVAGPLGSSGWTVTADPVFALVHPLNGGRWAIDELHLPAPLRLDNPDATGREPRSWALKLAEQTAGGVLDPTLATPSTLDATLRGLSTLATTADGTQTTHVDRAVSHLAWQPDGDGRITVNAETKGGTLLVATEAAGAPGPVTVAAQGFASTTSVAHVGVDQLGSVIRSVAALLPTAMATARTALTPSDLTPADRARLRTLVLAFRDLLSGVKQETTFERMRIDMAGQRATLATLTVAAAAAAPDGKLAASLRLALDGFDLPAIPPGPLRDVIPRRLTLTPRVSGVPADALIQWLLHVLDEAPPETLQADATQALAQGPIKAGFDDVQLDLGPAVVKGTGTMTLAGTDQMAGTALVTATGLPALIRRANTVPELRQAAPVLSFLKGIGEQKGDATSWAISYADGHTLVNGTDLAALLSQDPPAPPPRGRPR